MVELLAFASFTAGLVVSCLLTFGAVFHVLTSAPVETAQCDATGNERSAEAV